jgi:hypothetical protein
VSWVAECFDLAQAANLPRQTAERWREVDPFLRAASEEFGVPYSLLVGLVHVESRFNPAAVSSAGARGLGQTIDSTGRALASLLGIPYEPHNPEQSARMAALYLQRMLARFPNVEHAIAAYNAGPGAVRKYGGIPPFVETRAYVPAVLRAARAVTHSRLRCTAEPCPPNSTCAPSILPKWRMGNYGFSGSGFSPDSPPRPSRRPPSQRKPSTTPAPTTGGGGLAALVVLALVAGLAFGGDF